MRMGENPKVVSERLGHARVSIKLDIHFHTNEEMQKNIKKAPIPYLPKD